jgi:hypothetical protein
MESPADSSGFFPHSHLEALERRVEPRQYARKITLVALLSVVWEAFVARRPGLREIARCGAALLGTSNFSSLSHALARPSAPRFARALLDDLCQRLYREQPGDLVAIDTMMITLPATQRHGLAVCNNATAGGGVLWLFNTCARLGECPVRVLKVRPGAWRECSQMDGVALTPKGPIYLMDRGFYKISLVTKWLGEGVRFVIRARASGLQYQVLRTLGPERGLKGGGRLLFDGFVCVGSPLHRCERPRVRLVIVERNHHTFHLMTSEHAMSPEQLMAAYKTRWQIELFHRHLKETLGLAHLYSFKQGGVEFLLGVATLIAILSFLGACERAQTVVATMRRELHRVLDRMGLPRRWQRNTLVSARGNPKKRRRTNP